jgi:hypothetical protein
MITPAPKTLGVIAMQTAQNKRRSEV